MSPEGLPPYLPVVWLPGRHLQTIVPSFWPAPRVQGETDLLVVRVDGSNSVRVDVNRPQGRTQGTLLLVHGMAGHAESPYMLRTAGLAVAQGWVTARMNLRGCGRTKHLSLTLYNAGQAGDIAAVLERLAALAFPKPFVAIGFSLGGNMVLLHAGAAGSACRLQRVVAVNAPVDLRMASEAIEQPRNLLYRAYFLHALCSQVRTVRRASGLGGPFPPAWRIRTIRRFDEIYTAPAGGYLSADDYYERASSVSKLSSIEVPTLLIAAANDPFVPIKMFEAARPGASATVTFLTERAGGHVGYWQRGRPRFWAAEAALRFLSG